MLKTSVKDKLMTFFRKNAVPVISGCIAVIVLFFIGTALGGEEDTPQDSTVTVTYDEQEYIDNQEKKLKNLLSDIDGVGKCEVMIIARSGYEYVYAEDETSSESSSSSTYKILDSSDGDSALLLKRTVPEISGVAIVCEGGASAAVKNEIIEMVSKAFNISGSNISVAKMQ